MRPRPVSGSTLFAIDQTDVDGMTALPRASRPSTPRICVILLVACAHPKADMVSYENVGVVEMPLSITEGIGSAASARPIKAAILRKALQTILCKHKLTG
jgi:hypothetical protein